MPVGVVNLDVLAQQLLLAGLVGPVPPHLVAVLFGLEEGSEVNASPHLLTGTLAVRVLADALVACLF